MPDKRRPRPPSRETPGELRKTAQSAKNEVELLLKSSQDGTLTRQQLEMELDEVQQKLGILVIFIHK